MAKFKSVHAALTFYVDGNRYDFYNGEFSTDNPKVIDTLENMQAVRRVDEPVKEEPKKEAAKREAPKAKSTKGKSKAAKDEK
jgi:hypothetical protein